MVDVEAVVNAVVREIKHSAEWRELCGLYVRHRFNKAWEEGKHPRKDNGEFGTGGGKPRKPSGRPGNKPQPHKPPVRPPASTAKPYAVFAAHEQRHAEAQQDKLAVAIDEGAAAVAGNAPADVERTGKDGHLQAVEVKTKLRSTKVRMTQAAQARKILRLEQHQADTGQPADFHTVAFDHRTAYASGDLDKAKAWPVYYKRGGGSFPLTHMHQVNSADELNRLMALPDADLPDKAKPTTAGFWGRYNATKSKPQRQTMLKTALENERKRTRKVQP